MKTITKLCRDCGNPIESTDPRRVICESCRKKKLEEKKDAVRSLAVEDSSRRAAAPRHKGAPYKSIEQCVREADAMGISYGQYVARGLDQVV